MFLRLGCSAADLDLALARGLLFKKEKLVRETRYNKQNLYRNNREGENNKKRRERQMRRDMWDLVWEQEWYFCQVWRCGAGGTREQIR